MSTWQEDLVGRQMHERIDAKAAVMNRDEVVSALRSHVKRVRTRGASSLPSSVLIRAAELLEEI